ncbi:cytochrome o ubiquinol oxidase subunit III, partial [Klebsiella pneumoniae]
YDLFHESLGYVLTETSALLISSVTFGFAVLASYKKNVNQVITWLFITFLFGATFIGMELYEFHHLVEEGHGPTPAACLFIHI